MPWRSLDGRRRVLGCRDYRGDESIDAQRRDHGGGVRDAATWRAAVFLVRS